MKPMHRFNVALFLVVAVAAAGNVLAEEAPRGVSPGALDRAAVMKDGCSTFSWEAIEGVASYELVVYELAEQATDIIQINPELVMEVLFTRVPGGATSWTPEAADCLPPGGRFAWFVRAVVNVGSGEATEWSQAMLFAVPSAPSAVEVQQALEVLLRYVESDGATPEIDRRELAELTRSAETKAASRSVQTGTAAIRGEQPDISGETYGAVGTSASPDGAGLGAANTSGGPDLVLDGSADLEPDTELSQSGIDRPWASAQTFNIQNSAGAGMTLQVDGVEVVTTATDSDGLGALSCGVNEVAKFVGGLWTCMPDVDTVGALSCGANEIPKFVGGVWTCAADLDTNTDTLAGLMCASGQLAKWNGSAWACAEDGDALAVLGCAVGQVAKWTGSAWACAADDNTVYTAGAGLTINGGEISFAADAFLTKINTLAPTGASGQSSIAVGADGLPLISFFDHAGLDLKVAHCGDPECSTATISTIDGSVGAGIHNSIAIGADGLGLISYGHTGTGDLRVAHCSNLECTTADITTLEAAIASWNFRTSVAIGADGWGLIAYIKMGGLWVAHCNDAECSSAGSVEVDACGGFFCDDPAVTIGGDGYGLIGYLEEVDLDEFDLKVAHCTNASCSAASSTVVQSYASYNAKPSVATGIDGFGLISFNRSADLGAIHCNDAACSSFTKTTLEIEGVVGYDSSIAVDDSGLALISYRDATNNDLRVARCTSVECTNAVFMTVDSVGNVGIDTSIAIGPDGRGVVSYYDDTNESLKVARLPWGF